jgi:hypothetical protein
MTSPETEASAIFVRHLDRLHQDVMDRMRLQINQIDGTFDAAILNEVMKRFLHHNVTGAVGELRNKLSPDEIADSSVFSNTDEILSHYLGSLPKERNQVAATAYNVAGGNDVHALLMNIVPNHLSNSLKLLNGGRWPLEYLEVLLVTIAKSMN